MMITARTIGWNLYKIQHGRYVAVNGKIRCKRTFKRANFKNVTMSHLFAAGYVYMSNSRLLLTVDGVRASNAWGDSNPRQAYDLRNSGIDWRKINPMLEYKNRHLPHFGRYED